jgi:hypothetical protein
MNTSKWEGFSREHLLELLDLKVEALGVVQMTLETIKPDPRRPEMDARIQLLRAGPENSAREIEADIAAIKKILAEKFLG